MILDNGELSPKIDATARIAPNAVVSGDVTIGPRVSVGFGAVIVAESGPVKIGGNTVIMENTVLRGVRSSPLTIADNVLVGPRAYLSGCRIGPEVFLATGASVFNGAEISKRCEVRINGTVHIRTRLPAGSTVPIGWVAVGDPAKILPPDRHDEIWDVQKDLDFPGFVFGVGRPENGQSIMPEVMPRYAASLRRRHAADTGKGKRRNGPIKE
ncbi:gamma carbonic anhydrase family protein [Nisaea acidiphila]|uniref:Gamma carbonic anhydrase family protein n=1 Tax=Nisaea acidiphila TaxID=1862145 RepID=A0A9J7AQW7_9PROT|nr:gamma carbonic anhydrase family protein [Nisaea acidiphila]UUX49631.1 gamma carbonic anhydrase family protein [Nisaea acidiphila]